MTTVAVAERKFTKNLFLTGESGVGKTTLLFRALRACGPDFGGFVVKRRIERGRRRSMEMVDLSSGAKSDIAVFDPAGRVAPVIGGFIAVGVPSLATAVKDKALVVMDELGRFELDVPAFMSQVFYALDSQKPVIGVVKDVSNTFLDAVRARRDVTVLRLNRENREPVFLEVVRFLKEGRRASGSF